MIKRFILWYLRKKSLPYCEITNLCKDCPFGSESCECGFNIIYDAFEKNKQLNHRLMK